MNFIEEKPALSSRILGITHQRKADEGDFQIDVNGSHVLLRGELALRSQMDLAALAEAIGESWQEALKNGARARAKLLGKEVDLEEEEAKMKKGAQV